MLEELLRREGALLLLEMTRISALVMVAPLAWSQAPLRVRAALVIVLSLVGHAQEPAQLPDLGSPVALFLAVGSEFVIGAAMGFVVRLCVAVAEVAADVAAPMIGLGIAQVFDPATDSTQSALTKLFHTLAVLIAMLAGLHRVLLEAVYASFRVLPAGVLVAPGNAAPAILELTVGAVTSGVRIALPILAVLFMVQLGLAFISRAAPAMQIFAVGFSVLLIAGLLVVALVLPDAAHELLADMSHVGTRLETLLSEFLGPAP